MEHLDKNNLPQGSKQPWQQPDFSWDAMKDGIYERIEQEDPEFFPKERRRRVVPFWWSALGVLVLVTTLSIGIYLHRENQVQAAIKAPEVLLSPEPQVASPVPSSTKIADEPGVNIEVLDQPNISVSRQTRPASNDQKQSKETNSLAQAHGLAKLSEKALEISQNFQVQVKSQIGKEPNSNGTLPATETEVKPSRTQQILETSTTLFESVQKEHSKLDTGSQLASLPTLSESIVLRSVQTVDILIRPIAELKYRGNITLPKLHQQHEAGPLQIVLPAEHCWKLAVMANSDFSFTQLQGITKAVELRNEHSSPLFGFGYGLRAYRSGQKNKGIYLGFGMQHLSQNIDISTERTVQVLQKNVLTSVTHYVIGNRDVREYKDTLVSASEKNRLVNYNRYHLAQIEFGITRSYTLGAWTFLPNIGNSIGLVLNQKGYTVANDGAILPINRQNRIRSSMVWQIQGGLVLSRQIGHGNELQIGYNLGYAPLNWSTESGVSYRPVRHQLQLGIARKFCK